MRKRIKLSPARKTSVHFRGLFTHDTNVSVETTHSYLHTQGAFTPKEQSLLPHLLVSRGEPEQRDHSPCFEKATKAQSCAQSTHPSVWHTDNSHTFLKARPRSFDGFASILCSGRCFRVSLQPSHCLKSCLLKFNCS